MMPFVFGDAGDLVDEFDAGHKAFKSESLLDVRFLSRHELPAFDLLQQLAGGVFGQGGVAAFTRDTLLFSEGSHTASVPPRPIPMPAGRRVTGRRGRF